MPEERLDEREFLRGMAKELTTVQTQLHGLSHNLVSTQAVATMCETMLGGTLAKIRNRTQSLDAQAETGGAGMEGHAI